MFLLWCEKSMWIVPTNIHIVKSRRHVPGSYPAILWIPTLMYPGLCPIVDVNAPIVLSIHDLPHDTMNLWIDLNCSLDCHIWIGIVKSMVWILGWILHLFFSYHIMGLVVFVRTWSIWTFVPIHEKHLNFVDFPIELWW